MLLKVLQIVGAMGCLSIFEQNITNIGNFTMRWRNRRRVKLRTGCIEAKTEVKALLFYRCHFPNTEKLSHLMWFNCLSCSKLICLPLNQPRVRCIKARENRCETSKKESRGTFQCFEIFRCPSYFNSKRVSNFSRNFWAFGGGVVSKIRSGGLTR